jgi:peptidoglycan/xylan/chitin deacetylase (PgdA/CDA1 family)
MRGVKLFLLWMCRSLGLFRFARWLTRRHLKILCYHGFELADETRFRPKLFMSGPRFEQRLKKLRASGMRVLPLDDAVERLYAGTLPDHAVVVTVDDGFHSVAAVAAPRLQAHGVPATVYVTTYYVDNPNPIYRLVVQYMFWKTQRKVVELALPPALEAVKVDLTDATQAERAMWSWIRYGEERSEAERVDLSRRLGQVLDVGYDDIVKSRSMQLMSPAELVSLEKAGLDVQLHTHRHRFPNDDRLQAEREIHDNRRSLGRLLGGERLHFCYPSGLFDTRQFEWLDAVGIKSSTTCLPGLNSAATPRHALRRFLDGENIHQLEFEAALSGFTDLLRRRGVA